MRVLFVPSWYPSEKNPFAGSFIHDLARELVSNGIEVEVVASHQHFTSLLPRSSSTEVRDGVVIHHLFGWIPPKMTAKLQGKWVAECCRRIHELVDFSLIDIVHAQDYVGLFLASEIAKNYQKPLICSLHHSDFLMNLIPNWRKKILKDILLQTDQCIVPSSVMMQAIANQDYIPADRLIIVPNFVHIDQIRAKEILGESPQKYIMVSSSEKVKRPELAIEWMKCLPGQLDIYGALPNQKKLLHLINKNSLNTRIILKGKLPHADMLSKYSEYDACISTSSHETFGISILEALASGIPAIVASHSGPVDYITDKNGIIINQLDELSKFIAMYATFDAKQIRDSIESQYDVSVVMQKHLSIYHKIFAERCVV